MWEMLTRLWTDQAYFIGAIRACGIIVAGLFANGTLPTFVDGGGWKVALVICAAMAGIPAGERNVKQ